MNPVCVNVWLLLLIAGVAQGVCNNGDIRLRGSSNSYQGRVEICYNNAWGTVCGDFWGTSDARVVCRQLGFATTGALARSHAYFGQGTGAILLDNMDCSGTETRLVNCRSNPLGVHNCYHYEDAGVTCRGQCTNGDIRLRGSSNSYQGRVEICNNNAWGTVCDDYWGTSDARVVCRQLGFGTTGAIARSRAYFGRGTGAILLDQVACTGTETRLVNCRSNPLGVHDCSHHEDAGVTCRAVNCGTLTNPANGRVSYTTFAATYSCNTGFTLEGVSTRTCQAPGVWSGSAPTCHVTCRNGDIRLVGGITANEGRVEVCWNERWGTVCDETWSSSDAIVACRQLGFPTSGAQALTRAAFGPGTGPIYLDNLECTSSETRLVDCLHTGFDAHNYCLHIEDAGLRCQTPTATCSHGNIRLVGGSRPDRGHVEICLFNMWGTVCDDLWSSFNARVTCRQLGYSGTTATAYSNAFYGQGSGPILMDNVTCTGVESGLINCTFSNHTSDCRHSEDASVRCYSPPSTGCTHGDIRLVGTGTSSSRGRVEVCVNNLWGTVCDDSWGNVDARVACRQLGYSDINATAYSRALYGQGTVPILLDDVRCTGTESRLIDCPYIAIDNCVHSEDAAVGCTTTCTTGDLRLAGTGAYPNQGRVELCSNGAWGTVCDDLWSSVDASVVCTQLGFSRNNSVAHSNAFYGQGTGSIWLDNVQCTGTESRLYDCPASTIGSHNCGHSEDAGVSCQVQLVCNNGDIRLVNGATRYEGRVELCHNEIWGTICDEYWSTHDATVVCRQLGFEDWGSTAFFNAYFGRGIGHILLDDLLCNGSETRLIDCPRYTGQGIGTYDYCQNGHGEDAGVRCMPPCSTGNIRLVGGTTPNRGRVEVCQNRTWGTVCDDIWSTVDANVACRQLGYLGTNAIAYSGAFFGVGSGPIHLHSVACTGSEAALINCSYDPIATACSHHEDAGVQCHECTNNDIRLVGGSALTEGRVELCWNDTWGTVCDDYWGTSDATVVCRQLGYSAVGALAFSNAFFGQGTGSIFLDDLSCRGSETRLIHCPSSPVGIHNCAHSEDAGVRCRNRPCTDGDIRLIGGSAITQGRLEVCPSGTWGTVCDDSWTDVDASVVCRQLGYSRFSATAYSSAQFGQGSGPILLNNVACVGNESRLVDCQYTAIHNCVHSEDAGASCKAELLCQNGDIRLVNGTTAFEGRVEICWNETWGTICDGLWSGLDAQVACRQLGYSTSGARVFYNAYFGQGFGPIFLDDLLCTGRETRIINCPRRTSTGVGDIDFCRGHLDDAGLRCVESCPTGGIRLVGGSNDTEGRVEVCLNGQWGTVCDDYWGSVDAQVACRQLGFSTTGAVAFSTSFFGQGSGPIHLNSVSCSGSERRLIDCRYKRPRCSHIEDAGVRCQGCTEGAVRLRGGTNTSEGRVEVCRNNAWGTVCDDLWNAPDAAVVCRQLGFSRYNATALSSATFGQGSGAIILDNVQCTGREARLFDCPANPIGIHNCVHFEDASARCTLTPFCHDGQLRLVDGTDAREGRVEICFNETWGTICDDGWDDLDANVACSSLGYSRFNNTAMFHAAFGPGTGPIYMDNLACLGTEPVLTNCTHDTHTADCGHNEDASMRCNGTRICQNGDVRLVGGTNQYEGRVEVCWDEVWGTVCDDYWSNFDAQVTCRQLGFATTGATAFSRGRFGRGTGPILLDNLLCNSRETRLIDCPHNGIGVHNCVHSEDAGIRCQPPSMPPVNLTVEATTAESISLSWSPPDVQSQNGVITGYIINVTASETGEAFQVSSTTTNLVIQQLRPFTTYNCTVAAMTSAGIGPFSISLTVQTNETAPNASPEAFVAANVNSTSFVLSWSPPPTSQQNVPGSHPSNTTGTTLNSTHIYLTWKPPEDPNGNIREYRVNVTEVETGRKFQLSTNTNSIIIGSLHPYYSYNCMVVAVTIAPGPFSSIITVRTDEAIPTGPPQAVEVRPENPTTLALSWQPPSLENQNGIIIHYRVNITEMESGRLLLFTAVNSYLRVSPLHPFYMYTCTLAAVTVGLGPYSAPVVVQTPEDAPSSSPMMLTSSNISDSSFHLVWQSLPAADQNGVIRHYIVNITEVDTGRQFQLTSLATYISIRSLHPFYTYVCTVAASTVDIGPFSTPLTVTTLQGVPSSAPVHLQGTTVNSTTIQLYWNPPSLADQNGVIRSYLINVTVVEMSSFFQLTSESNALNISGLHPYYNYNLTVAAVTIGPGPYSVVLTIRMPEDVPTAPENVTGELLDSITIILHWNPPERPNGIITGYQVIYYGYRTVQVQKVQTGMTEVPDAPHVINTLDYSVVPTNLNPGLTYSFKVRAKTSVGYGENSTAFNITLLVEGQPGQSATQPVVIAVPVVVAVGCAIALIVVAALSWHICKSKKKLIVTSELTETGYTNMASGGGEQRIFEDLTAASSASEMLDLSCKNSKDLDVKETDTTHL